MASPHRNPQPLNPIPTPNDLTLTASRAHLRTVLNQGAYLGEGTERRYQATSVRMEMKSMSGGGDQDGGVEEMRGTRIWTLLVVVGGAVGSRSGQQHESRASDHHHPPTCAKVDHPLPDLAEVHPHASGLGGGAAGAARAGAAAAGAGGRPAGGVCARGGN